MVAEVEAVGEAHTSHFSGVLCSGSCYCTTNRTLSAFCRFYLLECRITVDDVGFWYGDGFGCRLLGATTALEVTPPKAAARLPTEMAVVSKLVRMKNMLRRSKCFRGRL